jgi:uncharacterized repeat protein (TIGR03806 family)
MHEKSITLTCLFAYSLIVNSLFIHAGELSGINPYPRPLWNTSRVIGFPDPLPEYQTKRVYEDISLKKPIRVTTLPGSKDLLVMQHTSAYGGPGIVTRFNPESNLSNKGERSTEVFLQIPQIIYGIAFHPNFAQNGYMYVGCNGKYTDGNKTATQVLRFTISRTAPYLCDPESKTYIIGWPSGGHNGGDVAFGLDGMLYVSGGDGSSDSDAKLTGQDMTNLCSKMVRIDVDHVTPGQTYSIPQDNPYVNTPGIRPEIWASGLRNPWRITVDQKTGTLWAGNNGQDHWEMIHVIRKGENYGWSVMEGSHPFQLQRQHGPTPFTLPTIEHPHSEARSITGGVVYYGQKFPELQGVYIYGDYSPGIIWGARYDGQKITWHKILARSTLQIAGFGIDSEGEVLIVDHGSGLYQLEKNHTKTPAQPFPTKLSETGIYTSIKEHKLHAGIIPYTVNSPLWSDGTIKHRYIGLVGNDKIEFDTGKSWSFPNGTVLIKSFSLPLADENKVEGLKYIETRVFTRNNNEWYGYSYEWLDDQSDAILISEGGKDKTFSVQHQDGVKEQTWRYPSRSECMVCHSRAANYVLGLSTMQLNKDHNYHGQVCNQLEMLEALNVLNVRHPLNEAKDNTQANSEVAHTINSTLPKRPHELPSLVDPYDKTKSLELRVRSYLHSNCAHCHVSMGGGNSTINLDFNTSLAGTKMVNEVPLHDKFNLNEARIIAPGAPERSVLSHRLRLCQKGQMPPLARSVVDLEAVMMIDDWIRSLNILLKKPVGATSEP